MVNPYGLLVFNFHTLYKFQFSDWLVCTTWHWLVMKQPPWHHYRGVKLWCKFNTPLSLHHDFSWLKVWRYLFQPLFNLNNKNVNPLIAGALSGFTCMSSLTMNEKFQYHTRPQVWGQDGWILAKFFFCVFMERGQYPVILTEQAWLITDLLQVERELFPYRTQLEILSTQDSSSSCLYMKLAI